MHCYTSLKELYNFVCVPLKVAAGTLDASTKIYAVRVDAVHADAYRVLGGLGGETKPGEGKKQQCCLLLQHHINTLNQAKIVLRDVTRHFLFLSFF